MSRGMKKFLPFASLKEQAIFLHEMQRQKQKIAKPEISEDTAIAINEILTHYNGEEVKIYYYERGFIKSHTAIIKKIDALYQVLYFNDLTVKFTNLLNIEIIN
ncbi:MAG: YolD-like family protein [Bacilli bacterium]|jgi:hypothetical protein